LNETPLLAFIAVGCVFLLVVSGEVLLFTASGRQDALVAGDRWASVRIQTVQAILSFGLLGLMSTIPLQRMRRWANPILVLGILAAVLPFFPDIGIRSGGATREVALGPLRWQPGLILTLTVVMWTAGMFARRPLGVRQRWFSVGVVALAIVLALLQPDFSLVPLILLPVAMQALRAGIEGKRALILAVTVGLMIGGTAALHPYVTRRVDGWLHPERTAKFVGRDYLLLQQGVASGGFVGSGYGQGKYVVQTGAAKTDYFFGHMVEELGLIRAMIILSLYLPILWLGLRVALRARDRFVALVGTGMAVYLLSAVAVHAAVSLRWIPVTAIHLPFLSFGGTPLVTSMAAMGILLSANRALTSPSIVGPDEDTTAVRL
jgi:cell division protein FtsW